MGGNAASPGEYPHQISLQTRSGFHFCGGSVIGDEWVLTAAHCVQGTSASSMQVELGAHRLSTGGEVFGVSQVIVHPGYNGSTNNNDVALLRLNRSAAHHTAIPLVDAASESGIASPGTFATVTGWGALSSGGGSPDVLMEVDVPILSNAQCDSAYRFENITDQMLCAGFLGTGGADSCQGDSGGPLVVDTANGHALVGVVSWGYGCADPNHPGVYARVSEFTDWVGSFVPDVQLVGDGGGSPGPAPGPTPEPEPQPADDHGDDFASATPIAGSATLDAQLSTADVDVFRLEVGSGETLTVSTTSSLDTFGTLYDSSGAQVATSDDDGPGLNFQITRSIADATYFVAVRGYSSSTTGPYTLVVDVAGAAPAPAPDPTPDPTPAPQPGDDHGDDVATATAVLLDVTQADRTATLAGTLDAGDYDLFELTVVNDSGIAAPVQLAASTAGSTDTYGTLYDDAGNVVAENDDANPSTSYDFGLSAAVQPGTYYLEVRGYSASTTGAYDLTITAGL